MNPLREGSGANTLPPRGAVCCCVCLLGLREFDGRPPRERREPASLSGVTSAAAGGVLMAPPGTSSLECLGYSFWCRPQSHGPACCEHALPGATLSHCTAARSQFYTATVRTVRTPGPMGVAVMLFFSTRLDRGSTELGSLQLLPSIAGCAQHDPNHAQVSAKSSGGAAGSDSWKNGGLLGSAMHPHLLSSLHSLLTVPC